MTVSEASGSVGISTAEQADLLEVFRIEKAVFEQPWPFSAFERYLEEPGFLVARDTILGEGGALLDGPAVVGYVVADSVPNHGPPIGHIKDLAVKPDRQGSGIGSDLLTRALTSLNGQGVNTVKLEVRRGNRAARKLYEARGFDYLRTVPQYYHDDEDAIIYVSDL